MGFDDYDGTAATSPWVGQGYNAVWTTGTVTTVTVTVPVNAQTTCEWYCYDTGDHDLLWMGVAVDSAPVCLRRPPPSWNRLPRLRPGRVQVVLLKKIIPNPRLTRGPPDRLAA